MKSAICCFCALLLTLACLLTGCGGDRGPVVMEYGGVRLTEDIYRYWVACYKAQFAYDLNEENREEIYELIDKNIKKSLVAVGLFNRYGLQLSNTAREQIDRGLDMLVEDIGGGNRGMFNEATAMYGIGYDGLKIAFTYEQMAAALREYLFGEDGYYSISKEQYANYCEETYARVRMIYISLVDFATDEDDLRIWDSESGSYVYTEKSFEELAAQNAKLDELRAALASVHSEEEFLKLVERYNEDPSAKDYTDGYYFSSEMDYSDYIDEVPPAALACKEGEVTEVRSEIGVHFLFRTAPTEEAWDKTVNRDFFEGFTERVRYHYFELAVSTELPGVTVYAAVKDEIDLESIPANWELYW